MKSLELPVVCRRSGTTGLSQRRFARQGMPMDVKAIWARLTTKKRDLKKVLSIFPKFILKW